MPLGAFEFYAHTIGRKNNFRYTQEKVNEKLTKQKKRNVKIMHSVALVAPAERPQVMKRNTAFLPT